jgi:hypothetical protein
MKITKSKLKQIIEEELAKVLDEQDISGEYEGDDPTAGDMIREGFPSENTTCARVLEI